MGISTNGFLMDHNNLISLHCRLRSLNLDAPAVDSLVVSPVHSPSIHSSSDAQCSSMSAPPNRTRPMLVEPQRQARPPAISPALKNHKWFPSPKKAIGKVRTVAQELHATSVVTSDKVVSMLEGIGLEKKNKNKQKRREKRSA
nr:uncharacterized protein LOC124812616 [Hydra vulgaris]